MGETPQELGRGTCKHHPRTLESFIQTLSTKQDSSFSCSSCSAACERTRTTDRKMPATECCNTFYAARVTWHKPTKMPSSNHQWKEGLFLGNIKICSLYPLFTPTTSVISDFRRNQPQNAYLFYGLLKKNLNSVCRRSLFKTIGLETGLVRKLKMIDSLRGTLVCALDLVNLRWLLPAISNIAVAKKFLKMHQNHTDDD